MIWITPPWLSDPCLRRGCLWCGVFSSATRPVTSDYDGLGGGARAMPHTSFYLLFMFNLFPDMLVQISDV